MESANGTNESSSTRLSIFADARKLFGIAKICDEWIFATPPSTPSRTLSRSLVEAQTSPYAGDKEMSFDASSAQKLSQDTESGLHDSGDDQHQRIPENSVDVRGVAITSTTVRKSDEQDFGGSDQQDELGTGEPKKSKKKKAKKKSKKTSGSDNKTVITWGTVEEITFSRSISYSSIPSKGTAPLGLGEEVGRSVSTINDFYLRRQGELLLRAQFLHIPILEKPKPVTYTAPLASASPSSSSSSSSPVSISTASPAPLSSTSQATSTPLATNSIESTTDGSTSLESSLHLETRQFDFKAGKSNLLFVALSEQERIHILAASSSSSKLAKTQQETREEMLLTREMEAIRAAR